MLKKELFKSIKTKLGDPDGKSFNDDLLEGALKSAVAQVSRFYPYTKFREYLLKTDYEEHIRVGDIGILPTAKIKNYPIEPGTEEVSKMGHIYKKDIDYLFDYMSGELFAIDHDGILKGSEYKIKYKRNKRFFNLSDIIKQIYKLISIDVYTSNYTKKYIPSNLRGEILEFKEECPVESDHLIVCYSVGHDMPTNDDRASYPESLEEIVVMGTQAYALYIKAQEEHGNSEQMLEVAQDMFRTSTAFLKEGKDYITKVSPAKDVPAMYLNYSNGLTSLGNLYLQSGVQELNIADKFLAQADKYYVMFQSMLLQKDINIPSSVEPGHKVALG